MEMVSDLKIPQKVIDMQDIMNKKVVEHNDLISSMPEMDALPLKIFELAVAHIDSENPPEDNTVRLKKSMILSFFDVESSSNHSRFKEIINDLHSQAVFHFVTEKPNGRKKYQTISGVSVSSWNDYDDYCYIEFNQNIMPYLVELKSNFTQYAITDIIELDSKYSVILYRWLTMNYNQYENYVGTGKRNQVQLEKLKNPYISMNDLRDITNTNKKYKRMHDFEKNVLSVAQKEINEHTHFYVDYQKHRESRKVVGLTFSIDKVETKAPLPYKDESAELEHAEDMDKLFSAGVKSEYTPLLFKNFILGFDDMQNTDLIAGLQLSVYPVYDEIKKYVGIVGVADHINYVANHKVEFRDDKKNIRKYLHTSAIQYLNTVKIQHQQ